ncbi:hypothetical protein BCON_0056g00130 [Botryotinia convoluta]|uniref:NADP-dependent L-serine/L-allo-threonine dehydrogenase ydfG n=1 Tax=Botryotinia convoluta TaxID=54673 RepID=A0A4Z1INT2_9HELO|nr:hypothetical protein BCON_0056g00130 [Botryotinia convoluta]
MSLPLKDKTALVTGASMGIGEAIATRLANDGANLVLLSRNKDKLDKIKEKILSKTPSTRVSVFAIDIQSYKDVDKAVESAVTEFGSIDILINNVAGLALGAPAAFWELSLELIDQMNTTNISGTMYTTHSVLNRSMIPNSKGTILNVPSVTGLETPPFSGEAVYHSNKACIEAFSNSLRMETAGTNIRVMVIRPGVVNTHFHLQRVKFDQDAMDEFTSGYPPLVADDITNSVSFMLTQPESTTIKALDCVPTPQRSLTNFDRTWNERNNG